MSRSLLSRLVGRGGATVTVPVMDGPLRPNQRLEQAPALLQVPDADNLVAAGARAWFSSGTTLLALGRTAGGWSAEPEASLSSAISCLAHDGAESLAIGLDGGDLLLRGGRYDGKLLEDPALSCPTACLFLDADSLLVAQGSAAYRPSQWKHDLMSRGRSGALVQVDLKSDACRTLLGNLAFPYGLARRGEKGVYFSESWRHRIAALELGAGGGKVETVLDELPGYPARLLREAGGRYWLSLFAPRTQIVEFVLGEAGYRRRMMAEIDPRYWVAPDLTTGASYLEPMQGGALKQMGILKPWAPPRSYGLVVQCDQDLVPRRSLHARADGTRHGITALAEVGGRLLATAKGPGLLLDLSEGEESRHGTAA